MTNENAQVNADSVVITDPIPQFTTYQTGTAKMDATTGKDYASASTGLGDVNSDSDGYDYNISNPGEVTYNAGNLPPSASVVLYFQVQID